MRHLLIGVYNDSFLDSYWVGVHFAAGLIAGFAVNQYLCKWRGVFTARSYWRIGFVMLLAWEYFELSLRYIQQFNLRLEEYLQVLIPNSFFEWESTTNIVSDLLFGSLGLLLVYWYLTSDQEK
ncbi:MAG: hypothetical protein HY422_00760 [Candidatus Komeilibacteria bacterium]|nr:hypothetical protein [Candidatus Komeilibacteria bacterium]